MPPDQPPAPQPVLEAPAPRSTRPSLPPSSADWQLLNRLTLRHTGLVGVGYFSLRPTPEQQGLPGYSLSFGEVATGLSGGFAAGGTQEYVLNYVPHHSLGLGLWRYQWEAGPVLGPLEPRARVGFTVAHVELGHRVSFGMFSPRVGLGVWWKLPSSRVGLSAYTEYLWTWVGADNAFVRGLMLELQPDATPMLQRSTVSPSSRAPE